MAGKPGRSGTNKGQDKIWSDALRRAVLRVVEKGKPTKNLEVLANKCVAMGLDGDLQAIREIGDRLDGKPAQTIAGGDGGPVRFVVENHIVNHNKG